MLVATSLETHTKVNLVTLGSHAWWGGGDLRPLKLEKKTSKKKRLNHIMLLTLYLTMPYLLISVSLPNTGYNLPLTPSNDSIKSISKQ